MILCLRFVSSLRYSRVRVILFLLFLMKLVGTYNLVFLSFLHHIKSSGHRVATQYLLAALEGHLPIEHLLHYREANSKLPGHPELGLTPGVKFSSGRLGHMWFVYH